MERTTVSSAEKVEIEELVIQVKAGDKKAFHLLYENTWKPVYYTLLKKIGLKDDALAVLNEVYVEVYSNIHKLESEKAFNKWITQIAFTRSMNFLKEKYRRNVEQLQGEIIETGIEDDDEFIPEKALMNKETCSLIMKIVKELPETQYETIFLFYYQDFSIKEIAEITACSENTVYKRLHDAKKSLKAKLEKLI